MSQKRRIVIAGASGFTGKYLAGYFLERGDEVLGLVRRRGTAPAGVVESVWDGRGLGDWVESLNGVDVLVNLAGRTVNCRYGARNKAQILDSRTDSTMVLGEAIGRVEKPPAVWINSSTLTIYRHAEDGPQDEVEGELGEGFSVDVAKAWEKAFFGAQVPGSVRKVALRTALVLARERGTVFSYLWRLARLGMGGAMGTGRQRVSWVHIGDFCRVIDWLIRREDFEGVVNVVAPEVPTNEEFMGEMRRVAGVGVGFSAGRWLLEVGAWGLRTETELVLKSRWGVARRLGEHGFRFRWPRLGPALADLAGSGGLGAVEVTKKSASPE